MSARWRRKQREDTRSVPIDPFEDLGPGDLGYRLRGGRTGLDPFDNALEQGRFGGMALKALFSNPIARAVAIIMCVAVLVTLVSGGNWTALIIIAAIAVGVFILRALANEDLERIRERKR